MKKRRLDPTRLIVGLLIFAVCMVALLTNSGQQAETLPRAGFADSTPLGGKGLRLVLENLGYSTARQIAPVTAMPGDAKLWLILDPQTRFSAKEAQKLLAWIKAGGTLLFCVRPNDILPFSYDKPSAGIEALQTALQVSRSDGNTSGSGDFLPTLSPLALDAVSNYRSGITKATGSARTFKVSRSHLEIAGPPGGHIARIDLGKGRVFVLPDALLLTNYALSKDDNAKLVTNLLRAHVASGKAYFDERDLGEDSRSAERVTLITYLKRPPVSYAIWQLLVAGLLLWSFAGRRLGSPVALPVGGPVTRASQFAAAMGALFAKTNRPGAAAGIIGTRFRRRLAQRLGLSPAESDKVLAKRAQEIAGIPFEVTDRLLLQSRTPAETTGDALRDAQQMEAVLRQLEGKF